jgi:uncharacterized protein YbjT (DUF2867 family)
LIGCFPETIGAGTMAPVAISSTKDIAMHVLLGSNGNITSKAAALLLAQGARVRIIGRNAPALGVLEARGAEIAAGNLTDASFLAKAFTDATAVYSMIPTDYTAPHLGAAQDRIGVAIAQAIAAAGVKRVVNLSSIGAHLCSGTGPIAGLHRHEERLNALSGVDVLHLRPGYFYENHLIALGTIATTGLYADMTAPDSPLPMVATADVAQTVMRELLTPTCVGKRVLHLRAPHLYTMRESTHVLGAAIDRPELRYAQSDARTGKAALMRYGFSADAAAQLEEMSAAFSTGLLDGEYEKGPTEISATTLEQFAATVFKAAYEASSPAPTTA